MDPIMHDILTAYVFKAEYQLLLIIVIFYMSICHLINKLWRNNIIFTYCQLFSCIKKYDLTIVISRDVRYDSYSHFFNSD